jgi:hypothetical protein
MRRLLLRICLVAIAVIAMPVLGIILWFFINGKIDEARLSNVQNTFQGLPREEAYTRLRQMHLKALPWLTRDGYPGYYGPSSTPWPSHGDVAVDFHYATRMPPEGACGATATAILIFSHDRVAKVSEGTNVLACL